MTRSLTIRVLEGFVLIHDREDKSNRTRLEEGATVNAKYDPTNDWITVPAHKNQGLSKKTWKELWDDGRVEVFQDFFTDQEKSEAA